MVGTLSLHAGFPGGDANAVRRAVEAEIGGFHHLRHGRVACMDREVRAMLADHRESTIRRMGHHDAVLIVRSGTDFRFHTRQGSHERLIAGKSRAERESSGRHLHTSLAVDARGFPLGLLRLDFDSLKWTAKGRDRRELRWCLAGLADAAAVTDRLPSGTRVLSLCESGPDLARLFAARKGHSGADLLVRARRDIGLAGGCGKLFTVMSEGEPDGLVDIDLGGSRRLRRPKRLARCQLRLRRVLLPTARGKAGTIPVTTIHVRETDPPGKAKALEWHLLTNVEDMDRETAFDMAGHHLRCLLAGEYHEVLKSSCRDRHLEYDTPEQLRNEISHHALVSWRVMIIRQLGFHLPRCPAQALFDDEEMRILATGRPAKVREAPETMEEAMLALAKWGGYLHRKHDPPPGSQVVCRGYADFMREKSGAGQTPGGWYIRIRRR